jgi:PAS domain S-box-containing protein
VKWSSDQKVIGGFALAVATLIANEALLYRSTQRQLETARWEARTRDKLEAVQRLVSNLSDAENGRRGYLMTGRDVYLAHYRSAVERMNQAVENLRTLSADNPAQQQAYEAMQPLIRQRLAILDESVQLQQTKEPDPAAQLALTQRGQEVMERIRRQAAQMDADERELLRQRQAASRDNVRRTSRFALAGSIASLGLVSWIFILFARENRRRRKAEQGLQQAKKQLEVRVQERTGELAGAVAALKESEERVRLVLDTALDAVITIDDTGVITSWNLEAERVFGWTSAEMAGRLLSDTIIPPRYREAHQRGLQHFLATGEGPVLHKRIEITALRRNGEEFPVELAITPVRLGGKVIFSAFVRDITARKQAEEELRRLNVELERRVRDRTAQLEQANQELEAFSYSVSHDLRAPLRHIDGFVDLLRREAGSSLTETSQRYLSVLSNSARQMGKLIDDLLVFSRMGRAEMRQTRFRMDELVSEVRQEICRDLQGRQIHWHVDPLPEVMADRPLLKQVWVNLLSNAVKYTCQRAEAEIRIGCRNNGESEIEFHVKDNGAGFDMQYVGKLFGVFQRLHQAEEFEGTGIGLANVRRIISRHGGRTWAEGEVNVGATVYFTLPSPNHA